MGGVLYRPSEKGFQTASSFGEILKLEIYFSLMKIGIVFSKLMFYKRLSLSGGDLLGYWLITFLKAVGIIRCEWV